MSTDLVAAGTPATIDERLDRLSAQVEEIAADLRSQRESRQQWEELAQTLVPVSRSAFDLASRELDDLSDDVTVEDAVRLARTLARSLPQLERMLAQVEGLTELGSEVTSLGGSVFAKAADVLAEAERNGYFAVARGGRTVMDRVVAAYADEDFDALGDNLVQLLGIAKELAGPEMTGLLDRTLVTLREGESQHLDPPSTFGLLKQLRDPQTRRGLARALALVQTIGAEPTSNPPASRTT
jgi:uncharacterized protein YjgD (DUF1641 family)